MWGIKMKKMIKCPLCGHEFCVGRWSEVAICPGCKNEVEVRHSESINSNDQAGGRLTKEILQKAVDSISKDKPLCRQGADYGIGEEE